LKVNVLCKSIEFFLLTFVLLASFLIRTGELIGFAAADVLELRLAKYVKNRVLSVDAFVNVVCYDTGFVLTASPNCKNNVSKPYAEFEEVKGVLHEQLEVYMKAVNSTVDDDGIALQQPMYVRLRPTGDIVTATLVPVPPTNRAEGRDYKPVAFVVQVMPPTVFSVIYNVASDIDSDVAKTTCLTVALGVLGLGIILLLLAGMSSVLTKPLNFVTEVANQVINNGLGRVDGDIDQLQVEADWNGPSWAKFLRRDPVQDANPRVGSTFLMHCMPKTEVVHLVKEFQQMIHCFSGKGPSQIAEPPVFQIKNEFTWHSDFARLYDGEGVAKKSYRQTSVSTETDQTEGSLSHGVDLESLSLPNTKTVNDREDRHTMHSCRSRMVPVRDILAVDQETPNFGSNDVQQQSRSHLPANCKDETDGAPVRDVVYDHEDALQIHADNVIDVLMARQVEPERRTSAVRFSIERPSPRLSHVVPPPTKVNRSPILGAPKDAAKPVLQRKNGAAKWTKNICHSSLFWWIVLLMAFPILLTNLVIGAVVSTSVSGTIPLWTLRAEEASNAVERQNLQFIADRKACTISTLVQGTIRDLHLMTRITNWLVFGGIQRSDSLTEVETASEECKDSVGADVLCPYYTPERMPCACNWECPQTDFSPFECQIFDQSVDTRYLQRQNFIVQSADADRSTGNRKTSPGYPEHCYSPETTQWWQEITDLPGSEKGPSGASGYETLFDRLVVSSATSTFNFPIYNYATALKRKKPFLGGYVAFNDDGLFQGWTGCHHLHIVLVGFQNTVENGAVLIDPLLCPSGKFGYDPRCRDWYAIGREKYKNDFIPVHVTGMFCTNAPVCP
jgi:hypothetical protein